MIDLCRTFHKALRYWIFPESRVLDERTAEIDHQRKVYRQRVVETGNIVRHANQPDTLRNLVIAMTSDKRGRYDDG